MGSIFKTLTEEKLMMSQKYGARVASLKPCLASANCFHGFGVWCEVECAKGKGAINHGIVKSVAVQSF